MKQIAAEMSASRAHLMNDIDRDADAYQLVMDAYRLPKTTKAEIVFRNEKIEEATKNATFVQMEVAERAYNLLDLMIEVLETGNYNAATDGLVGLMTCRTAINGALLNVRTNLESIQDTLFIDTMRAKCDRIEIATDEK